MIVDDSWWESMIIETRSRLTANYHALSYTIIDYHQLSFALNMFKIVMIVDDSFSLLTARMIVDDSWWQFGWKWARALSLTITHRWSGLYFIAELIHDKKEHSDWFPQGRGAKMDRSRTAFNDWRFWKRIQKKPVWCKKRTLFCFLA